ncbi:MAG: hypothetical protein SCH39_12255 [Methanosarcinales archaeon]|nr:hypothetical protein [Methanosarcinales archaeon]
MVNRLIDSREAVSEVVGYIMLLGVIVTAVGLISVLAFPIIEDAKEDAYLKNMEQGFTVMDSKVSLVALGKSPTQLIQMYSTKGDISVYNQNTSHITVSFTRLNNFYEIYNQSLGTVQYQLGENKIAYEGGGVFRKYPGEGDPVTITPPEFHYNGETLTLPIIKVDGNQSIGGSGVINLYLVSNNTPNVLYPNPDFNSNYTNPLTVGNTISVVIKSDYYMAWANYIEERTDAEVTTNSAAKEVRVKLNAKPNEYDQEYEPPIDVFGFNTDNESALKNFSMVFANGSSNFKSFWTTSPSSTEPYFKFETDKSGGLGTDGVSIELKYYDNGDVEYWKWDVQALKDADDNFDVNFLNSNGSITYVSNDDSWTWVNETNCSGVYTKFDTIDPCGGQKLLQHYMALVGPTFSFTPVVTAGFNPDNSTFVLYYDVMPPRITFMHVVEHKLEVKVG